MESLVTAPNKKPINNARTLSLKEAEVRVHEAITKAVKVIDKICN